MLWENIWDDAYISTTKQNNTDEIAHSTRAMNLAIKNAIWIEYTQKYQEANKKKQIQKGGGKNTHKVGMDLKKLMAMNPFVLHMTGKKVKSCTCKTGGKTGGKSKKTKKRTKRSRRTRRK